MVLHSVKVCTSMLHLLFKVIPLFMHSLYFFLIFTYYSSSRWLRYSSKPHPRVSLNSHYYAFCTWRQLNEKKATVFMYFLMLVKVLLGKSGGTGGGGGQFLTFAHGCFAQIISCFTASRASPPNRISVLLPLLLGYKSAELWSSRVYACVVPECSCMSTVVCISWACPLEYIKLHSEYKFHTPGYNYYITPCSTTHGFIIPEGDLHMYRNPYTHISTQVWFVLLSLCLACNQPLISKIYSHTDTDQEA